MDAASSTTWVCHPKVPPEGGARARIVVRPLRGGYTAHIRNNIAVTTLSSVPLRIRPARMADPADQAFFATLYRSTRDDLLALIADPRYIDVLIATQQRAQVDDYRKRYPDALYEVLELAGAAAGRLVTAHVPGALRVVDLAVLPPARRRGVAREALRHVQRRAAAEGRDVTLAVRKDNPGARRLYAALGFAEEAEDGGGLQLRWRP
jgi:ribosomal protein S18 acetylase RimI-like enzyme